MMVRWCRYDLSTGRPVNYGHCSEPDYPLQAVAGFGLIAADVDPDVHYIDVSATPHKRAARPALAGFSKLSISANNSDTARLTVDRPFGATIDGVRYDISTPEKKGVYALDITASIPATYRVDIDAWPYLPYSATITAT
jgi:hypothetical protein